MQKKLTRLVFLSTLLYAVFCSAALFCFLNEKQDTILIYAISGLLVLLICGWLSAYFGYKNVLLTLFVCNLLLLYIFADIIYDFNSSMVFLSFFLSFF